MANFDDNPFAGDSENPFAVSICCVKRPLSLKIQEHYRLLIVGIAIPGSRLF